MVLLPNIADRLFQIALEFVFRIASLLILNFRLLFAYFSLFQLQNHEKLRFHCIAGISSVKIMFEL